MQVSPVSRSLSQELAWVSPFLDATRRRGCRETGIKFYRELSHTKTTVMLEVAKRQIFIDNDGIMLGPVKMTRRKKMR